MTVQTVNAGEDQTQYVAQIYQEQYARLLRYFLRQLGNAAEAEACVQETIRRLFYFMEDRDWESESEYVPVYLMRIAGLVCSRKLREGRSKLQERFDRNAGRGLLNRIRTEAVETVKERIEFVRRILSPAEAGAAGPAPGKLGCRL